MMRPTNVSNTLLFLVSILFCIFGGRAAQAQANLGTTPAEFEKSLNEKIGQDTINKGLVQGSLVKCKILSKDSYGCLIGDANFQQSVKNFKKLNLLNGSFSQRLGMILNVENDRVASIIVVGTREDPVNVLAFDDLVLNIISIWDNNELQQDSQYNAVVNDLGLTSGDDDSHIGSPQVSILFHLAVTCLRQPSSESLATACRIDPRS